MIRLISFLFVLALGAAFLPGLALAASCTLPSNSSALIEGAAAAMNASRAAAGRAPLAENATLDKVAQAHACWMSATGKFSHSGNAGSSPRTRVKSSGYCSRLNAENIAWGQTSGSAVNQSWMESSAHKRNLMLRNTREFGLGVAILNGKPVWVAVYANPC